MSFTAKILVGLGLGVVTGLLLGEDAAPLRLAADAFVRLLQMTVLPFITVSLISGIGGLDASTARRLFLRVGSLTLVLWGLSLGAVFLMPLAFPELQSAAFFSTTLVEEHASVDFVALYIPSNPFHSLANAVVPAVVLFSAVLGIALMGVSGKQPLIEWLRVVERAVARANRLVARLTPFGLFAIAAHASGTLDLDQVARLRVYLICYGAMALLLSLWVFPGLVAALTAVPARRVLGATQDVLITAFVTADLFIVLPSLIVRSKQLLSESAQLAPDEASHAEFIVPSFYNFPHAAKLLSLSFVIFAAWFSETLLGASDYPRLALAGIVSLFGSMNVAIPFLLDLVRVPADTFQLFLATGVVNSRFGTLAAAMHMVVLAVAGPCAMSGRRLLRAPRIGRYLLVTAGVTAATVSGLAVTLRALGAGSYEGARVAEELGLLRPSSAGATLLSELPQGPLSPAGSDGSVLEGVRSRGRIRVGFVPGQMPYSHFNSKSQLVGLDVEMAHALAQELGVAVEFAPVGRDALAEALDAGRVDVIMAGVALTTQRAARLEFSMPYLDETVAFIVPDHRRAEFSEAARVRSMPGLRLGVPELPYLEQLARREFPAAQIVDVPLADAAGYLAGRGEPVDALLVTAERGSFMTLLHPAFSVAVPQPLQIRVPLAYPVARRDAEMARFLSLWIDLKRKDGTLSALYDHWILGRGARARTPRWSLLGTHQE